MPHLNTESTTSEVSTECKIGAEEFHGWSAVRLSNGMVDLVVVPDIGGRILQLRLGRDEYLYINPRHLGKVYGSGDVHSAAGWKNYGGSKVWPAPQGWISDSEWPGPPDPVLDGGPYKWAIVENEPSQVGLVLASPPDEYTGLTFSREIRLAAESTTVTIHHRMRNTSVRPVRWALWQVTQQVAGPDFLVFAPAKTYRQILGDNPFRAIQVDDAGGILRLEYKAQVAKLVVPVEERWICSLDSSRALALVETFEIFRNVDYVDGAPVAFWVNGPGPYTIHADRLYAENDPNGIDPYVETELLSPLVELEPGQEYSFRVQWRCSRLCDRRVERVNSCAVISRDLKVVRENNHFGISACYGVFQAGFVELVGICRDGRVAGVQPIGPVTPLVPCVLERSIPAQKELFRVSLRMKNRSGELLGTIGSARVGEGPELTPDSADAPGELS